jgi:pimeloyl-ACP methyl ester carboxylesterase
LPVEHQLDLATQLRLHLDQSSPATRRVVLPSREAASARLRQAAPALSAVQALRLVERNTEVVADGVVWRWDPRLETRTSLMLDGLGMGAAYWSALEPIQSRVTIITAQTHVQKHHPTPAIRLPHAQHVVLPGDHNLQWEQPEAVARLIAQATAQLAASPTEVRI